MHVCTLHARLRILDKLLMLHINYAWNMEPVDRREECIRELEDILSSVGLHGNAIKLTKDRKASGATQDWPNKICMGGRKASIFFQTTLTLKVLTSFSYGKECVISPPTKGTKQLLD